MLRSAVSGDVKTEALLSAEIHGELQRLARSAMRRERVDHTLQPTALVNEAYLRLVGGSAVDWVSRAQFYVCAAKTMRRILIDHARARGASKRGGEHLRVEITESLLSPQEDPDELIALDEALDQLGQLDARAARTVELRYFAGLGFDEVAQLTGVSVKTAKRDWEFARVWLERALRGENKR